MSSFYLQIWVWVEARSFISSAIVNADELVKYDMYVVCAVS
jgi:aarF domain-containing kinase